MTGPRRETEGRVQADARAALLWQDDKERLGRCCCASATTRGKRQKRKQLASRQKEGAYKGKGVRKRATTEKGACPCGCWQRAVGKLWPPRFQREKGRGPKSSSTRAAAGHYKKLSTGLSGALQRARLKKRIERGQGAQPRPRWRKRRQQGRRRRCRCGCPADTARPTPAETRATAR